MIWQRISSALSTSDGIHFPQFLPASSENVDSARHVFFVVDADVMMCRLVPLSRSFQHSLERSVRGKFAIYATFTQLELG